MSPEGIYLTLFRALPEEFRERFGEDLRHTLACRAEAVRKRGGGWALRKVRATRFWARELTDLARTVVVERGVAREGRMPRGMRRGRHRRRGGVELMDDVRLAFRGLRRNPMFGAVVTLTLALGIGLNTAIFSVVDTVVLRPLPYPEADRLVHFISVRNASGQATYRMAYPDFLEYAGGTSSFSALGGYRTGNWVLSGPDRTPSREPVAEVTNGFFQVMGVSPRLGRGFDPSEHTEGRREVVILSHSLWTRSFGADPDILGRTVQLGQTAHEVIGVMPAGFDYPFLSEMGGWVPMQDEAFATADTTSAAAARDWISVNAVGRLADGVGLVQAQSEVDVIAARLAEAHPETNADLGHLMRSLQEIETGSLEKPLLLTLAAVALILLIACVNVASLLLARGASRREEVVVRVALGASRSRLVRLFLTESLLYAVLGGALGIVIGVGLLQIVPFLELSAPRLHHVRVDLRVLGVVAAVSLGTGMVFGLLPALRGSRTGLPPGGGAAGRGGRTVASGMKVHRTLVAVELAVTTVLAVGAGLLANSLFQTLRQDPGFDPRGVLTMRLSLPSRYMQDPEDQWSGTNDFFHELASTVRGVPGVAGVALSYTNPLEPQTAFNTPIEIPGWLERPRPERPQVNLRPADPGFFQVFDLHATRGRVVDERDRKDSEGVVVINQAMADLVFGDQDPLGYQVTGPNFWGVAGYPYPWTIVGVVPDVRSAGLNRDPAPAMYLPFTQAPMGNMRLMIRTAGEPESLMPAIREAVWAMDPALPVDQMRTMEAEIQRSVFVPRFAAMVVGLFALIAVTLAAVGVFGVLSYTVGLRHREFGIRQALGASDEHILRLVAGQGITVSAVGIAVGLLMAAVASRFLEGFLFGVHPLDALTYAGVALGLLTVAGVACVMPARRATRTHPSTALQGD